MNFNNLKDLWQTGSLIDLITEIYFMIDNANLKKNENVRNIRKCYSSRKCRIPGIDD